MTTEETLPVSDEKIKLTWDEVESQRAKMIRAQAAKMTPAEREAKRQLALSAARQMDEAARTAAAAVDADPRELPMMREFHEELQEQIVGLNAKAAALGENDTADDVRATANTLPRIVSTVVTPAILRARRPPRMAASRSVCRAPRRAGRAPRRHLRVVRDAVRVDDDSGGDSPEPTRNSAPVADWG